MNKIKLKKGTCWHEFLILKTGQKFNVILKLILSYSYFVCSKLIFYILNTIQYNLFREEREND